MATIDIRCRQDEVTHILFADDRAIHQATDGPIIIEGKNFNASIRKEDVENLIKALQKAVELGWTK